jgi:hypothetical protein
VSKRSPSAERRRFVQHIEEAQKALLSSGLRGPGSSAVSPPVTDLEISKALALAIGWTEDKMFVDNEGCLSLDTGAGWDRVRIFDFDYRDWNVIAPIAQRYNCFPQTHWQGAPYDGWLAGEFGRPADTPQKAIALTVIGAKK